MLKKRENVILLGNMPEVCLKVCINVFKMHIINRHFFKHNSKLK